MKQLVNVLIAAFLAVTLSGFSISAAEAEAAAGDPILEFRAMVEQLGGQQGAAESPETEQKYSLKRFTDLLASLFSSPPQENIAEQKTEMETKAGSPENLTVPETSATSLEQAEIEQKYVTKLQLVISDYEREVLAICDSAGDDLDLTLLGLDSVAEKYRSAAQALEANCDGYFYLTLANFRRELQSGGYPDDAARSVQERYESTKQQDAARLDEAIGK